MSRRRKKSSIFPVIGLVVLAVGVWIYDFSSETTLASPEVRLPTEVQSTGQWKGKEIANSGAYEKFDSATLVSHRSNDGDSFLVRLPNGREEIFRLYFVDTPESAFRTYRNGDTNHRRIADQARDMDGISSREAVKIGKRAKEFTLSLLEKHRFTILTAWDSPFKDGRYHAFVLVQDQGKERFLHEILVEKGFARIHTKGADLPDSTPRRTHEKHLHSLSKFDGH